MLITYNIVKAKKNCRTTWIIGPDEGVFTIYPGFNGNPHPQKLRFVNVNGLFYLSSRLILNRVK